MKHTFGVHYQNLNFCNSLPGNRRNLIPEKLGKSRGMEDPYPDV
jgi:hypothetical protein